MIYEETYKWIQDRLRDLHSGNLSEHDLARLREIAQTDPFVADALEGYQTHSKEDHSTRLNTITHRIRLKTIRRKPILLSTRGWIIQAAAACLIFIIATWAVIQFMQEDKQPVIAIAEPPIVIEETPDVGGSPESNPVLQKEEQIIEEGIPPESTGLRANAGTKAKSETASRTNKSYDKAPEGVVTDGAVKNDYTFVDPNIKSQPATSSGAATETIASQELSESAVPDPEVSDSRLRDEGFYANQMNPSMMSRRVTGIIQDPKGQPLIGASLNVNKTNLGTISDHQGRFELFLPALQNDVDVTYSGYVDTSIKLKQGEEDIRIVLPERSDLQKEVAVQSKTLQTTANVPAGRAYTPTRPKNDSEQYGDYLRNNSRIPIQENAIAVGKEVTLQFNVDEKGRPQDLLIVKSSNDVALDEEAVRLVKRGPDWGCELDMFPCTTRYTIYFK